MTKRGRIRSAITGRYVAKAGADPATTVTETATPEWVTAIHGFLAEPACTVHRSYYPAGELDPSPIVLVAARINQVDYDALASGHADYVCTVVEDD